MALIKIKSESMNLADDYAFTGTVTGAGGGSVTKISTADGAGANSIDFTSLGSYTYWFIMVRDLVTVSDVAFRARFYNNGSLITSSSYRFAGKMRSSAGNNSDQNGDGNDAIDIMNAIDDNAANEGNGSSCIIYIPNMQNTRHPVVYGQGYQQSHNGNKNAIYFMGQNTLISAPNFTGIRLFASSGNFTTLQATLYGVS